MAAGVNVYYNYTGQTKCFNITQAATSKLGTRGWDYQVWECNYYIVYEWMVETWVNNWWMGPLQSYVLIARRSSETMHHSDYCVCVYERTSPLADHIELLPPPPSRLVQRWWCQCVLVFMTCFANMTGTLLSMRKDVCNSLELNLSLTLSRNCMVVKI